MIIAIAGPYSAPTPEQRQQNLDRLNMAAARVYELGHVPVIGVNAALPVVAQLNNTNNYEVIMKISMAVVDGCDALLIIEESPGANRERDLVRLKGLPVYTSIEDIPPTK